MNRLAQTIYLLSLAYALCVLAFFPKWTVDDAYITFRYARNLAEHGELNWNVGEDPVEGYTGIALPVILAGWMKLGGNPEILDKAIGVASFLGAGLMLVLCLRALKVAEPIRAIAFALFMCAPMMFTHAFSGLETMLFTFLLLASRYLVIQCIQKPTPSLLLQAALLLALLSTALTRPEGAVLASMDCLIFLGDQKGRARNHTGRPALLGFLFYFLPALLYFIWRAHYYGQLFPNTFYAKAHSGIFNPASLRSLVEFFLAYLLMPIALQRLYLLRTRALRYRQPDQAREIQDLLAFAEFHRTRLLVFGPVKLYIIIVLLHYLRSSLIMNYSYRFFIPFYPLFLLILGYAFSLSKPSSSPCPRPAVLKWTTVLILILLTYQASSFGLNLRGEIAYARGYKDTMREVHAEAARFINANVPKTETMITYMDSGIVPYLTGMKTIDFGRLNDEKLARGALTEPEILNYFFSADAGVIVFTSRNWHKVDYTPEAERIVADPRFARYALAAKFRTDRNTSSSTYYQFVFLRSDLARNLDRAGNPATGAAPPSSAPSPAR